ncbi:MAG: DinB family protein [Nocardioidaceae bacterium]|nr:DinB family protein [Nocardioidaceae bacterium]MCL2611622.1 DinB family protein [Nocardioidaceae bacterium]
MTITPDTKDWTWVLDRPCPECGFDAPSVATGAIAPALRGSTGFWADALARPGAAVRPAPGVWSAVEYGCHVRDVHRIFADRVRLMLSEHDPLFASWDQDETAPAERYDLQDAGRVAGQVARAAEAAASTYDGVVGDAWQRPGRRDNGSAFTIASLGRYHLHDAVHHRWDLRRLDG